MKLRIAVLAIAVLAMPAPALAADESADAAPKKEKKVCRSYKVTGSLTRVQRICRTAADWKDADAATRKGVDKMQGSASGSGTCRFEDPSRAQPCY